MRPTGRFNRVPRPSAHKSSAAIGNWRPLFLSEAETCSIVLFRHTFAQPAYRVFVKFSLFCAVARRLFQLGLFSRRIGCGRESDSLSLGEGRTVVWVLGRHSAILKPAAPNFKPSQAGNFIIIRHRSGHRSQRQHRSRRVEAD